MVMERGGNHSSAKKVISGKINLRDKEAQERQNNVGSAAQGCFEQLNSSMVDLSNIWPME